MTVLQLYGSLEATPRGREISQNVNDAPPSTFPSSSSSLMRSTPLVVPTKDDVEYYEAFPESLQQRNQTAELLYLIWGGRDEASLDAKKQGCEKLGMLFADDKILPETFRYYYDGDSPNNSTSTTTPSPPNKIPKIFHDKALS